MNAPIGLTIGNASETKEALEVLHGKGPADLVECTMLLGAEMLVLGGKAPDAQAARSLLQAAIDTGDAVRCMEKMVEEQKGDPRVVTDPSRLTIAPVAATVEAARDGFVSRADALELGLSAVALGAGRTRAEQKVDPTVGIELAVKPGARVKRGDPLARIQAKSVDPDVVARVTGAFAISDEEPAAGPLLLGRVD
jgi:thymidine phosphorylase